MARPLQIPVPPIDKSVCVLSGVGHDIEQETTY